MTSTVSREVANDSSHLVDIADRLKAINWHEVSEQINQQGYATVSNLLTSNECDSLASLYGDPAHFRKQVIMQQHAFGKGEYKYFQYPLPSLVETLRQATYPCLAPLATRWQFLLSAAGEFPHTLEEFLGKCHAAGQTKPTPLLLKYQEGDYNCLHQDLYGELVFPFQITVLLSAPHIDFEGGEFVLVEQRPRAQSKAEVIPLTQGEAVIFAVHDRPAKGSRETYKVKLRHGVSKIRCGERYTLGIIFHDAK